MDNNAFLKRPEEYIRDHDIIENYRRIITKHLASKYKKPIEEIKAYVEKKIQEKFKPVDPTLYVLRKDKNRDRVKTKTTLTTFLNWVDKNKLVLGPNLVVYQNAEVERSYLSEFVLGNLAKRSKTKKQMAEYFALGLEELGKQSNLLQGNYKLFNNSISGATSSPHNSLYCASSHTTLTSICRSCTSFANMSNEKLIASNRAYFTLDDALANIADIASRYDRENLITVFKKYNLNTPTVDKVVSIAMESLKLYNMFNLEHMEKSLYDAMTGYDKYDLAAVAYIGDLNAFKDDNDEFLRKFIGKFLEKPSASATDADAILSKSFEDVRILGSLLNAEYTRGTSLKQIKKTDPNTYALYAAHVDSISQHLEDHKDFIHVLLSTHTVPHNLHSVPNMTRKAVVGSDTDSSIFSVQELVLWHEGNCDFSESGDAVSAVFAFIATQVVGNAMLTLSRQLGVREDQFYRIGMKSEYFMPVLALSNAQKHYMYLMGAKEESVYAKDKLDVRGVGYKNSRVPSAVMDLTNKWYYELLMAIRHNKELTPYDVMAVPAFVEHTILNSIDNGETGVYLTAKVKTKETYANPKGSVYNILEFWNGAFGDKYGVVTELPCSGIKVNVMLKNRRDVELWCANMKDQSVAENVLRWCKENSRWSFSYLVVPEFIASTNKMPEEILPVVDRISLLTDMTTQFYLFMTTFGIYMGADNGGDFVHDVMTMEKAKKHDIVPLKLAA